MKTSCPNCGAEVEFRYDDSFVRVCDHCRCAVLRTDRGVDSLGQVADLVPMDSPLALFADGHLGSAGFLLVGMAQIRHGSGGLWQEWYAKLDGGKWGWLAEAQGRYYLTFEEPAAALPPFESLAPGQAIELPVHGVSRRFTVSEHAGAAYVAATGELPYKLVPDGSFRFVDLDDGAGTFATIDYGDTGDAPALYVGQQVTLDELGIRGGEHGPSRDAKIASQRLACPNCNAPIELHAPGDAQRYACTSCNHLIALDGNLRVLGGLPHKASPSIPLGSVGKLPEGELTVIGFVQRSAHVDGAWYPFEEYLLYAPAVGFRWLVCSDGHWSYVQPVAVGAVEAGVTGCRYDGVKFTRFTGAPLRVDQVLGEFYWQVEVGETVDSEDFIAPPAMLSSETTRSETTWSLGTYMTIHDVQHAFGDKNLPIGPTIGVAPNQVDRSERAARWMAGGVGVMLAIGIVAATVAPDHLVYEHAMEVHAGSAAPVAQTQPIADVGTPGSGDACAQYRVAVHSLLSCEEIPKESRDSLVSAFPLDSSDAVVCQAGVDSVKQILARTKCELGSASGSGSSTVAGSGSGSSSGSGSGELEAPNVFFSDPFQLDSGHNVEVELSSPVDNDWVYAAADLVNQDTGDVVEVESDLEYYHGIDDGEAWSEGSHRSTTVVGPPTGGTYILRVEAQHGGHGETSLAMAIHQGVFRGTYLILFLGVLGIPWLLLGLHAWSIEKRRWENSTRGKPPVTSFTIVVAIAGGIAFVIWGLFKLVARSSSND
ncbi:MAG TPA: DUF4178 domain-containing protein [Kofleriaceae bacterium]|nr:DUF4178 domain-containing protein [Kofleriaceae bacterium]